MPPKEKEIQPPPTKTMSSDRVKKVAAAAKVVFEALASLEPTERARVLRAAAELYEVDDFNI